MEKIDFCDYPLGIGLSVWHNMGWKAAKGVDIYQDDDGSIHIFPHKISLMEARNLACDFLHKNKADTYNNDIRYEYYGRKTACIIFGRGEKVRVGVARFNPSDEKYLTTIGEAIAYSRASGKKLPSDLAYYLNIKQ